MTTKDVTIVVTSLQKPYSGVQKQLLEGLKETEETLTNIILVPYYYHSSFGRETKTTERTPFRPPLVFLLQGALFGPLT